MVVLSLIPFFFFFFVVQVLHVNQLPRVGELGSDLYIGVSLARAASLGELEPTQDISWPSRITFAGEGAELCLYGDADGEPLIDRDDTTLYHALHMHSPFDESMQTLGKRMLAKPGLQWATCALLETWCYRTNNWLLQEGEVGITLLDLYFVGGLPLLGEEYEEFVPSNGAIFGANPLRVSGLLRVSMSCRSPKLVGYILKHGKITFKVIR
ncbi:hypothetical protein AMTR_s00008p00266580 [Amborella trichopoda]|uniref:Uncharacterized protein n=1 Tax=Amborella trichopoda TaxID=13333 RepID=W1NJR5_AMBTC|nr:hypothetical protein AMTR_s00008p00266580 [Amborella trichopoda]